MGREADAVGRLKRLLPWLALAAVAVALVVWFGEFEPSEQRAPQATSAARNAASQAVVSLDAAVPSTQEPHDAQSDASRVAVLAPTDPANLAVSSHAGFWIEVVFADDGAPAAGAELEVFTLAHGDLEQVTHRWAAARREMHQSPAAPISMVLPWSAGRVGEPKVADAGGRVQLFQLQFYADLRASARRNGTLYRGERRLSYEELQAAERVFRVELHPAFEGTAAVLDADGEPVAGIALVAVNSPGQNAVPEGTPGILAGAVTDRDGRAVLFDPSNRVALALESGAAVVVEALALFEVPVRAALVAGEETVLRLPPMGSVSVELPEGNYTQAHEHGSVSLSIEGGAPAPFGNLSRTLHGGRTKFAHVGLGLRLAAALHAFGDDGNFAFAGPTQPGEDLRIVAPEFPNLRLVQFQLVDESGEPLVDRSVGVTRVTERGTQFHSQLTDGAGMVRLDRGQPSASPVELRIHATSNLREGPILRTLEARVDLGPNGPLPTDEALYDGGVLVLRQLPVLVSGRVVDSSGAPIPGATVDVETTAREHERSMLRIPGGTWTSSDANGAFLIEGELVGQLPHLVAQARGFDGAVLQLPGAGQRGVEVVLSNTGAVRFTLVLPEGLARDHVKVQLRRGTRHPFGLDPLESGDSGSPRRLAFEQDRLELGMWGLEVFSVADPVAVLRFDFDVPLGGTADLGELDLTGRIETLEVRATTADGSRAAYLAVDLVDGERPVPLVSRHRGGSLVPKPPDGAMVELRAWGCLPLRVAVTGPVLEVDLQPIPSVRLVLPAGLRIPSKRLLVSMAFERLSGADVHSSFARPNLTATHEYLVPLGAPGRFRLRLIDFPISDEDVAEVDLGGEFELRAVDFEQNLPVELPVDAEGWARMLERHDGP